LLKDGKVQAFAISAYNYSFNNPVNLKDETGAWPTPDTILDLAFVAYSAYDVASTALSGGEVSGTQRAALQLTLAAYCFRLQQFEAVHAAAKAHDVVYPGPNGDIAVEAVNTGESSRSASIRSLQGSAMATFSTDDGLQEGSKSLVENAAGRSGGTAGALTPQTSVVSCPSNP